ncbi:unnamed protein product [Staurois parvus]|uniref:Uncharacterized protein n=1 Tax=Staurois parvus TaxID=386267 RepID=A0ABN9B7M0_9NEOB|nr:unnamed protein product [Staurois parvus]
MGTGGWYYWAQVGDTAGWHRWGALLGTVGALLGTGGRTAGHRWVHCWAQVGGILCVALLGTDDQGTGDQ